MHHRLWMLGTFAADVLLVPLAWLFLPVLLPVLLAFRALFRLVVRPYDTTGKVVIITGASSGIGEQLAYVFARHNTKMVLAARGLEKLRDVANRCSAVGARHVEICRSDLGDERECHRIVETAVRHFGGVDVLVLNAGLSNCHFFERASSAAAARAVWDVNFVGPVALTHYALPWLKARHGQIIVLGSATDFLPYPRQAIYNASKSALRAFFLSLRSEPAVATRSVNVTLAVPGVISTQGTTSGRVVKGTGKQELDMDLRDEQYGPVPMMKAQECAKVIFNAARRYESVVLVPFWYVVSFFFGVFARDYLESAFRVCVFPMGKRASSPFKWMVDYLPGSKRLLYGSPADTLKHAEEKPGLIH